MRGHWQRLVLTITVIAMIAAACSESSTSTTLGNTTATTEQTSENGGDEPTVPNDEEVILQARTEEAADLIPLGSGQQGKGHVYQTIFHPLLETDNEKQIISRILESWVTSPDATQVTLTLKDDIEWSDGTPITSADVYMSLTQYLDANISNWATRIGGVLGQQAFTDGTADNIEGLTVVDDRTVTVQLENADAAWLPNIAAVGDDLPILPEHILGDVPHSELLDHDYFRTFPVSSGPYKFVQWSNGQFIEFERNDNWSLGSPGFERVFFRFVSTDVMTAQLEAGELQFITPVDPADADRLAGLDGVSVGSEGGVAPELWSIMHDDGSLDVRVRQAMLHAIDREGICEEALAGRCSVPLTNIRQLAPDWAIPTVEEFPDLIEYDYDPDRARQLLAEAEADGAWDPNQELIFYRISGRSYVDTATTIAQGQLAEVGINWSIVNIDTGGVLISTIREDPLGTIDGFWVSGADFSVDPSAWQVYTSCETARTGANLVSYCRPELDELWDAGRQTAVQEERAEIYKEAFRYLNQDPVSVYLYVVDSIVAYDSRIQGIKPNGAVGRPYWNIGEWTWEG